MRFHLWTFLSLFTFSPFWHLPVGVFGTFGSQEDGEVQQNCFGSTSAEQEFWANVYKSGVLQEQVEEDDGLIREFLCDLSQQEHEMQLIDISPPPTIHPVHKAYYLDKYGPKNEFKIEERSPNNRKEKSGEVQQKLRKIVEKPSCINERNPTNSNDPVMDQVMEGLQNALSEGKRAISKGISNQQTLERDMKIRIVHAVMIVAKRNRIPKEEIEILKGERGETMSKKKILEEMIRIWKEQRGRRRKGQKGKSTGGEEANGGKGEKRQKHILRLVLTMMDEDGSELLALTRKKNGSKRRRKRDFLGVFLIMMAIFFVTWLITQCNKKLFRGRNQNNRRSENQNGGEGGAGGPVPTVPPEIGDQYVTIFRALKKNKVQQSDDGKVELCSVCLDPLTPGTDVIPMPPCKHIFHSECIELWMQRQNSCPICRALLFKSNDGKVEPNFEKS